MHWFFVAAVAIAAIAAWMDWRTGNIPNWLTLSLLGVGPVAHVFYTLVHTRNRVEASQAGGLSVLAALLCAVIPVGLYRASALGGGDLKLFVGLGALLMPLAGLEAELWSFCAAAVLAPIRLAWDGKLFQTVGNAAYIIVNPFLPKSRQRELDRETVSWFRMGPAILVGTLWTAYLHVKEP
jgi:prepilin peptidase CpaA